MADLADQIDDLICTFEGSLDNMDTLVMYLFGWGVLVLLTVTLARYLYKRIKKPSVVVAEEPTVTPVPAAPVVDVAKKVEPAPTQPKVVMKQSSRAAKPTPPLRKRLTAKKGEEVHQGKVSYGNVAIPVPTGPDPDCVRWVSEFFKWLYSDLVVVNELIAVWVHSLNEFAKKSVEEHGVGVEIVRLLPETPTPQISNVFCESNTKDDITVTCDYEATPALQLKALRQRGDRVETSHYRLNVNRFRARLNAVCITEKLQAVCKCDGWPDIKVALAAVGSIKNTNLDEQNLQDVVGEIVVQAMRSCEIHWNLGQYPNCPRFSRFVPSMEPVLPVHYDSLAQEMAAKSRAFPVPPPEQKIGDKRLLIKVLHAKNLSATCQDPYCVIEMDDPPQKNQTCFKKSTSEPVWDEHFLFDISSGTGEILFEVYDRASKKFLGLAIVGIEELIINPNQRQTISLQTRPYETDDVTGTLTVEFTFIEGAEVPLQGKPYKLKETLRNTTAGGNITTTKTIYSSGALNNKTNGACITNSALQEIEQRSGQDAPAKTTLIIHSVQRHASVRGDHPQPLKGNSNNEDGVREDFNSKSPGVQDGAAQSDPSAIETLAEEGRSRKRKRDFFGTIKRRLNRSRHRSKSVEAGKGRTGDETDAVTRSVSADRMRDASAHSTVPSLRINDGETMSRRSSLSDLSGLSGASTRTYVNEASTLVLETIENGVKKHYLIPLSLAQKSKWRRKGTKLHIFNDHTFVAKHLPANTTCQVCATLIPRRFGKQGYECRDCLIQCHKPCHVRADQPCPQSTIQNIELCDKLSSPFLDHKRLPPIVPPRLRKK